MTLDELRLRVMAAFPKAALAGLGDVIWAEFWGAPLKIAETNVPFFGVSLFAGKPSVITGGALAIRSDIVEEIERRILSVTAHQLIAARRRLAWEAAS